MSRVGRKLIPIPKQIKISFQNHLLTVEGSKGKLSRQVHSAVDLEISEKEIRIIRSADDRKTKALHGLTRALVSNMVTGVTEGFVRTLEINGIGYRAEVSGNKIVLNIGYSQPVNFNLPEGITATVEKNTVLKLSGIDKEKLGLIAASIRKLRPPEPYKGKGIKYAEERIRRKAGKTGTK